MNLLLFLSIFNANFLHMKKIFLLATTAILPFLTKAQTENFAFKNQWVDSVYNSLTIEQKIGQLFMVAAYSGGDKRNDQFIESLIDKKHIGGIIFMQGTAEEQIKLTNKWQKTSAVKLLIGMDAEWGLGMRLTGIKDYPKQMTIAATDDIANMVEVGNAIADQCKRAGVHINFAPCIDINNNPKNPVINFRSFGIDKDVVSQYGLVYMHALQSKGVLASAKHFPGHGDVSVDSHLDLPVINKSYKELYNLEWYPFRKLINEGVKSIMIAHLHLPQIDNTPNLPTTLSPKLVTNILKDSLKYEGLIITDAMDMKGVTKYFNNGEAELKAFTAGNDIILFAQHIPSAIEKIKTAVNSKRISEERLAYSVKKILETKYDLGLTKFKELNPTNATQDLNQATERINYIVADKAATLIKDENKLTKQVPTIYVAINANKESINTLKTMWKHIKFVNVDSTFNEEQLRELSNILVKQKYALISVHNLSRYPGPKGYYGLNPMQIKTIKTLSTRRNTMITIMGTPYLKSHFPDAKSMMVAYEDNIYTQKAIHNITTNKFIPLGKLPI